MKKTFVTCLAVVAALLIASSASASICTIDQRPAATLLVPYFQVAINSDMSVTTGAGSLDTIVTIGNASSAPMIAHVSIYNERSFLVLDFNVALTGFDVQAMSMAAVLSGNLPATPVSTSHASPDTSVLTNDPCMRNGAAHPTSVQTAVDPYQYMRIRPCAAGNTNCDASGDPADAVLATTLYPSPAWPAGGSFAQAVIGQLTEGLAASCPAYVAPPPTNGKPARGYIVIDHVNYCTISDPSVDRYYTRDAIGMENNLFGEVIFTSGSGVPTVGVAPISVEASKVFGHVTAWTGAFVGSYGTAAGALVDQTDTPFFRERTFYARYWNADTMATYRNSPDPNTPAFADNPWNQGFGDEREPLGLKYAARYFEASSGAVTSFFRVWRASSGTLTNLLGSNCTVSEPSVNLTFFDEDENTIIPAGQPPCPSPCSIPTAPPTQIPLETQRINVGATFTLPAAFAGAKVGWVSASLVNLGGPGHHGLLDQAAWDYEFSGAGAFYNASQPATQLDPTSCRPLALDDPTGGSVVGSTACGTGLTCPTITNGTDTIVLPDPLTNPVTPGGTTNLLANPPVGTGS
jgi:hypothetical protein